MEITKKNWYKNEWIVAVGSGIILLIVSPIFDIIKGDNFTDSIVQIWNAKLKIGWALAALLISIMLIILIRQIRKKHNDGIKIYSHLFEEGTQVILKTNHRPVMVTGKINDKTNMVLCSWTVGSEIKHDWINQNLLKIYEPPEYTPKTTRQSRFWL